MPAIESQLGVSTENKTTHSRGLVGVTFWTFWALLCLLSSISWLLYTRDGDRRRKNERQNVEFKIQVLQAFYLEPTVYCNQDNTIIRQHTPGVSFPHVNSLFDKKKHALEGTQPKWRLLSRIGYYYYYSEINITIMRGGALCYHPCDSRYLVYGKRVKPPTLWHPSVTFFITHRQGRLRTKPSRGAERLAVTRSPFRSWCNNIRANTP